MSSLNKTSTFIENQLPGFIVNNPDYALFVQFLEKYYEFLELPNNPIYELRRSNENYDVNAARKNLLKYFKNKILPSFPEETELSTERIIKASRDFYAKKGTPDSFKFLFRILYGQEVDIFLPKTNILRASDGKWQIPQAIRISFSDSSYLLPGNVKVWTANANTVSYTGNLFSTGLAVNSFIRIGGEKRKITVTNYPANTFNVDVRFANTAQSLISGVIYEAGNSIYRLITNDNATFNYDLLNKKTAVGANSKTTCIIEGSYKTYDPDSSREIAELYVSNVNRQFEAGELVNIDYQENGIDKTFSSKIISVVSGITLEKDRFNKPISGNRYLSGDPVVFYDGLDKYTDQYKKAIAVVDEVTTGGIDVVRLLNRGNYFRTFANDSLIRVQSESGIGANLVISDIYTDGLQANSESFTYVTDSLMFKKDILLNDDDYEFDNVTNIIGFTTGSGNSTTTVNLNTATYLASTVSNYYKSFVVTIIEGTGAAASPNSAVISKYSGITKRAILDTPLAVAPDATSKIKITANASTELGRAFSYDTFVMGKIKSLDLVDVGVAFAEAPTFDTISTFETDYSEIAGFQQINGSDVSNYDINAIPYPTLRLSSTNNTFPTANGFYTGARLFVDTGDNSHYATVVDYVVTDPSTSANVKTLFLDRKFENNITPLNISRFDLFFDYRQNVQNTGKIGSVEILNGGTNYSAADVINFIGTGINAKGSVTVDASGKIINVTMTNRGEGYYGYGQTTAIVNNSIGGVSAGTGASFFVWGLSDSESIKATVTDIGKIKTFDILNRGYGYSTKPNVSLKVLDVYSNTTTGLTNKVSSGDIVWQGAATITGATFNAIVDDVYDIPNTQDSIIRLYNYNGSLANTTIIANTKTGFGNVTLNVSPVVRTHSFNGIYDAVERQYPYFYGDGLALAKAEFLNGLIKYPGYYLNTDGFVSADQRLQDSSYYHNYAYEIQSEKSIDDYRSTVLDVIHPAGMELNARFLMKDKVNVAVNNTSNICISNTAGGLITAVHYTTGLGGSGLADLAARANVGDLIVINSNASPNLSFVRTIASVSQVPVATVEVDLSTREFGDGYLEIVTQQSTAIVRGNTYPVSEKIQVGDIVQIFGDNGFVGFPAVTGITGTQLTFSLGWPRPTQNATFMVNKTFNNVPYRLIKIFG